PEAAKLCTDIENAFGSVPYPGDDDIVDGCDWERVETREILKGKHWRDVSFEDLDKLRAIIPLLSPEGLHFYLPAFMTISLVDYDRADIIPDSIIAVLTLDILSDYDKRQGEFADKYFTPEEWRQINEPMRDMCRTGNAQRWFDARVSRFTQEQAKVIRRFIEYLRDTYADDYTDDAPQKALDRYWNRF
ncbi:hypothetical protein JDN40_15725, partial [Rhodomicrobium vannielii ATCC 17100]